MTQKKAGVLLNYVLTLVHILSGIIYVPLLLSFVSASDYGVYKLMVSLIGFLAIMDFGLSNTVIRYYSTAIAKQDEAEKQNILAICLIIFSVITAILLIFGIGAFFLIKPIFQQSLGTTSLHLAKMIYVVLFINLLVTIPTKVFTASIFAHERFVFIKIMQIFQGILTPVLVLVGLMFRSSVIIVVIIQTISNAVSIIITIIYAFKKCRIKIKLNKWNKPLIKEITIFSSFIFLAMIVDQLYFRSDSIIIGAFLGSISVAIYSISSSITDYFRQFSVSVGNVFIPQLTKIETTTKDIQQIDNIFRKTGRIQNIILFLILSGFVIFGLEFIAIWTSSSLYSFSNSNINLIYLITIAILVPLYIPSIQSTGISILQVKNKHKFRSISYLIIALINIAASIILVKSLGIWGCIIATAVSLVIGQCIIMNIYYAKIGLNIKRFFKEIFFMTIPLFIFAILCYFINRFLISYSIWILGMKIFAYSILFALICYSISLNKYEKNLIKGLFKKSGFKRTNEKYNK